MSWREMTWRKWEWLFFAMEINEKRKRKIKADYTKI